ncbi:MAG: Maf family protein [Nanoarchaeota archaeon]
MQLILASNSWIRTMLFDKLKIQYTKDPPQLDEEALEAIYTDPKERVVKLSEAKAQALLPKYKGQDYLIIGSDSQNLRNGVSYGKPKTKEEAFTMIKSASGSRDTQISGWCLINAKTGQQWSGYDELHFDYLEMDDNAIWDYVNNPINKTFLCSGGFDIGSSFYLRHCARVEGSHGIDLFVDIPTKIES